MQVSPQSKIRGQREWCARYLQTDGGWGTKHSQSGDRFRSLPEITSGSRSSVGMNPCTAAIAGVYPRLDRSKGRKQIGGPLVRA